MQEITTLNFDDVELSPGDVNLEELPKDLQYKFKKRKEEIDHYFNRLGQLEAQLYNLENLRRNSITTQELEIYNNTLKEYEYLKNNSLEAVGLTLISGGFDTNIETMSVKGDASVPKPTLLYDNDMKMYVLGGSWKWNKYADFNSSGGDDGFGLRVEQESISIIEHGFNTYNFAGKKATPTVYPKISSYGLGFTFQDKMTGSAYNAASGKGWIYMKFYNGTPVKKTVNISSVYSHTWGSTKVNGFSVGPYAFGLSWTSGTNYWEITNYNAIKF